MSLLWTSEALVAATDGRPLGPMPEGISGISIDSRSLQPGDAFFAIKGETMDGHDFVTAAIKAGAGVLVVAEGKLPSLGRLTAPIIVVEDVLVALEKLGVASRARSQAKIIAVTGSAGKTTTKEALRHVLSAVGKVHASAQSFNNHWGVPLTLARMPDDCDYAVFEIGMNHPDEIRPLVKMVRPHVAIVTMIAAAHLGFFRNLDEIARAKAEIFEGLEPEGAAVLNRDDARFKLLDKMAQAAGVEHVYGFGENARSTFKLVKCELHADHSDIAARISGHDMIARIGAPGRHMVQNVLAVLGAAHLVGADLDKVALALADLSAERGRGKRHVLRHPGGPTSGQPGSPMHGGPITLIDESYNANPASMAAAMALLNATPVTGEGRRIAVLGDMLELGDHSAKLHAALADLIVGTGTRTVFLGGPEMRSLAEALPDDIRTEYRAGVEELKPLLLAALRPGDVVMIKSSKGIGFAKLVDALLGKFPAETTTSNQT
ncbi:MULTISPECIES: UDP-N-acetylmuramoylalanyl-D-glutamyl-2,6-diaminopimelate--D-alanyl-D-alanine ligase [unclassified Mesorhizobium]|uniref:UDP-N-acetylmuramoylalanyl-D-glutamyl-2, 6-diaminopimelate--D-alanyl-D-alanine ligase n=1 Tax=unclassified Mesorhizobium TaxID=325217 RepID=UPI000FCBB0E1|nr:MULTISPECIES: UDP-N-acetylmuramoylalanyl-D-glutamyl-2,6-diaminopimelate--D-alanyl-D-alanine ligase [unclassified Mesorhizobium]TGR41180.1 UDP-N-acetylmuramoylalanyl-D-glutamyl-2,6-diaminopimelate--D-alanyl-D-alanine ligase [bacterium M00.F.Ca.ET.199.01.1.1]TGU32084.1 UDP-N-acetylmuramoylalanyl-D-glutamyl-2,6-diaminopimelate--D-alanyl-D-alanine ligase [bacterium M00.F.Ca.ET.156.01.1.1]TGV60877.1 UDP-N-acetylmuramoylalanyl-D-glutamyl-2,6-diaminopimelate--D-alanyl-D-alanine ligase [bacterium M00